MADDRLRRLERELADSGDPESEARLLRERLRAGVVSPEKLELAAHLGHVPALIALDRAPPSPDEKDAEIGPWLRRILDGGRETTLRAAIACARGSLYWRDRFDGPDEIAVAAIEAVEAWLVSPDKNAAIAEVERVAALAQDTNTYGYASERAPALFLCTFVTDPTSFDEHASEAFAHFTTSLEPPYLRRVLRDELSAWAVDAGDPVALRPARSGRFFGREPGETGYDAPHLIVRGVAFSRDGRRVLTCGSQGTVTIWDFERREPRSLVGPGSRDIFGAAFSPDERSILTGDFHGEVVLRNTDTGNALLRFRGGSESVGDLAFVGQGEALVVSGGELRLFELLVGKAIRSWSGEMSVRNVVVAPDRKLAVAGAGDGKVRFLKVTSIAEVRSGEHGASVEDIALSPDSKLAASIGGRAFKLWDVATGQELRSLGDGEVSFNGVVFSPDGRFVASVGHVPALPPRPRVEIWSVATGERVHAWDRLHALYFHIAWSPDGKTLLAGGRGGGLRLFDVPERILRSP